MTPQEKKNLILKKIGNGDTRSYNQIAADLELELWTLRYKTPEWLDRKLSNRKS